MREIRSPLDGIESPLWRRRDGFGEVLHSLLSPGAAQLMVYPIDERFLFQDLAATTPVTATGQLVGVARNVGGGFDAVAPSDAQRPTFRRSGPYTWLEWNNAQSLRTATLAAPGVDKAQIFAACTVTGANDIVVELGPDSNATNGSIALRANATALQANSRGTVSVFATDPTVFGALAVFSALGDISGDTVTLRRSGAQVAQGTTDQGTGNYNPAGAMQLSIARRVGNLNALTGVTHGAIIFRTSAANLPATTLSAVEAVLASAIAGAP